MINFRIKWGHLVLIAGTFLAGCGQEKTVTLADGSPTPNAFKPVASASNIRTENANLSYIDTHLQVAFDILNGARGRCGFGYWTKDSKLDVAAANHVNYMVQNNLLTHEERPERAGFTGREVSDRAYAAGFDARYGVGELAGRGASAAEVANNLLAATYHLGGVIGSSQKVGMAFGAGYFSAELADTQYLGQRLRKNQVATYPCQGEVVATTHVAESPHPFPGQHASSFGSPFALKTRDDQHLNVTSYQLTSNGVAIPTALLDSSNDPNGVINPGFAYVIPLQPLTSGVTYAFQASGDVDGTAFSVAYTVSAR